MFLKSIYIILHEFYGNRGLHLLTFLAFMWKCRVFHSFADVFIVCKSSVIESGISEKFPCLWRRKCVFGKPPKCGENMWRPSPPSRSKIIKNEICKNIVISYNLITSQFSKNTITWVVIRISVYPKHFFLLPQFYMFMQQLYDLLEGYLK